LFHNTAQRADGQLTMQGHNAAYLTVGRLSFEHNVSTTLPDLHKAQALQGANSFLPRHSTLDAI
jgi:hypothetical protein